MDDRTVDLIFAGSLESLPPVSSKIVRIFTSSTFTGTSTRGAAVSAFKGTRKLCYVIIDKIPLNHHLTIQTQQWNVTH